MSLSNHQTASELTRILKIIFSRKIKGTNIFYRIKLNNTPLPKKTDKSNL